MTTIEPLTPPPRAPAPRSDRAPSVASVEPPTFREMLDDILPVVGVIFVAGPPVVCLAAPWVLLALMLSGPFALLVAFTVVGLVAAALLACLVAILAAPVVLVRRLRGRRRSARVSGVPMPAFASAPLAAGRRMIARSLPSGLAPWNPAGAGGAPLRTRGED